jgi:hypothetical protein
MYNIIPWNNSLDLTEFYREAHSKGFNNNSSKEMLIDSLSSEKEKQVWILFYNNTAVGSVAAHSFPEMGDNCYRIASRTCVLSHLLPLSSLRTINQIKTHQHVTSQFLIPACIDWTPKGSKLFITTNQSAIGTQRLVHNIYGPAMEEQGSLKRIKELLYRGHSQTVWELLPDKFYESLNQYPRWQ